MKKFDIKDNVLKINNPIITEEVFNLANEIGFDDKFDGVKILTVGRLNESKGQDMI